MASKEKIKFIGSDSEANRKIEDVEIKAYKKRWIILSIFMVFAAMSSFQWIEYAIMTNIIMKYYNVSSVMVDWTSMIYMALYLPLVVPASYIIDKMGLRTAILIGGIGTALGTAIKVLSLDRDRFYVVLIGQGILSASQLLILPIPPRVAAVWFKPNEVSRACSLGVFGILLGTAIGFVLPPMIVKDHPNPEDIGADLRILCWGLTLCMIPVVLAIIFCFSKEPPKPPSITQAEERNNQTKYTLKGFFGSLRTLLTNKPFMIHTMAYGINVAVFSAVSTLLNQFVLQYFENAEEDAGRMGLVMVLTGLVGSVFFGVFLDKTHKYKETTVFIYFMSAATLAGFMFALELRSKILVYVAIAAVGLFTNAYMSVGFELAMELTFPSPESTTTGLIMAPSQIMGVIFTLILGRLNAALGPFWAISSQASVLLLGSIITCMVPNQLKRQDAFKQHRRGEFKPVEAVVDES